MNQSWKIPKLRDYQQKAINLTRKAFHDGHRKIIIFMATGGGKGLLFIQLTANALLKKRKVLLVMRRKQLVYQSKDRFNKCNIKNSILMAKVKGFDPDCDLQICSIDTIARRDKEYFKKFNFVIIDEMQDSTSPTYQKFLSLFSSDTPIIGLSATPFQNGSKSHDFWDCCVKPIEMHDLKDKGFLVPCSLYVPSEIDLSDVSISKSTKDYDNKQLGNKMSKLEIIGNVIDDYIKIGQDRPAICFCVNKEHSIKLCYEFNQRGIKAAYADESTKQKDRDRIIKEFRENKIQVLCNVGIFTTGLDVPEIEVAIMARPTRSEILWIQMVGRAFRPYRKCGKCKSQYDNSPQCPVCGYDKPSYIKKEAIVIDSGNNCSRLGHPYDVRYPAMSKEENKKNQEKEKPLHKTCKHCFYVYSASLVKCPMCDGETETPSQLYETKDGKIVPYDEYTTISKYFYNLTKAEIVQNWKPNAKYFKLYEKYGNKVMKYSKEFDIPKWIPKVIEKNKTKELEGKLYV